MAARQAPADHGAMSSVLDEVRDRVQGESVPVVRWAGEHDGPAGVPGRERAQALQQALGRDRDPLGHGETGEAMRPAVTSGCQLPADHPVHSIQAPGAAPERLGGQCGALLVVGDQGTGELRLGGGGQQVGAGPQP